MPVHAYRAYTNIALIKYWGKRDAQLFLPETSSLSLTLDALYTETRVEFNPAGHDAFYLDGVKQSPEASQRVYDFIDLFRQASGQTGGVRVDSVNHVPTAAGLASSASAFAALACACNDLFEMGLTARDLSTYARRGSGSASRSLFGGFVLWHRGEGRDSSSSYAQPLSTGPLDIGMLVVVVDGGSKKISSREGMDHTRKTSSFYPLWPDIVVEDLAGMMEAIEAKDFISLGEIAEHNAMTMHATMLASKPPFCYLQGGSIQAIDLVHRLRQEGIDCYYTMDAGPNVKVICRLHEMEAIKERFAEVFSREALISCGPGPAPHKITWTGGDAGD